MTIIIPIIILIITILTIVSHYLPFYKWYRSFRKGKWWKMYDGEDNTYYWIHRITRPSHHNDKIIDYEDYDKIINNK